MNKNYNFKKYLEVLFYLLNFLNIFHSQKNMGYLNTGVFQKIF